jgi:hypothetical protein
VFEQLDFLYTPSRDVAADVRFFTEVLGGRLAFAIDGMGTRVAMIELTEGPPRIMLADHLEGERPVLVYRVTKLEDALAELEARGWQREGVLEIPSGPCCSFRTPGGHRIAVYELTRPQVVEHFAGRRDF